MLDGLNTPGGIRPVRLSLQEYGRGLAGGLIFSLPLLYTMEVWSTGFTVPTWAMLACLGVTFILLLGYNRYAGLRHDAGFGEVVIDSVEEMGLGLLMSAGILFFLDRISLDLPFHEILGRIVLEAMTVAIGVSVGTAQLGGGEDEDEGYGEEQPNRSENDRGSEGRKQPSDLSSLAGELILAFCGAVLFAANVAPTEEILLIAVEASVWKLLIVVLVSLGIATLILFYIEFISTKRPAPDGYHWTVFRHLTATYAIALLAAALMLWFFQRFDGMAWNVSLAQVVVLAFPAALGASAGRLLIQ